MINKYKDSEDDTGDNGKDPDSSNDESDFVDENDPDDGWTDLTRDEPEDRTN